MSDLRIGIGYDTHAFVAGRSLVLGGIEIPNDVGLAGHSDADVVVHALMDALLSAARVGDIGEHFPSTDSRYRGVCSIELLEEVARLVEDAGFRVVDADIVLVMEEPKISPYRDRMRERMAQALRIRTDSIGLKATTTEGLGPTGRGEGATAEAVVILERR